MPAENAQITKFLGIYVSREAALRAYEAAKPKVAIERRLTVRDLPPRVERVIVGGINIIETEGSKSLRVLEDRICENFQAHNLSSPAYLYNGEVYLVKMATDLDWLGSSLPLRQHLSNTCSLLRNPFMLTADFQNAIEHHLIVGSLQTTGVEKTFGNPNDRVTRHKTGTFISWKGATRVSQHVGVSSRV